MITRPLGAVLIVIAIIVATASYIVLTRPTDPGDFGRQALVPVYGSFVAPGCYDGGVPLEFMLEMFDERPTSLFGSPDNVSSVRLLGPDGELPVTDWSWTLAVAEGPIQWRRVRITLAAPDSVHRVNRISFSFVNGQEKVLPAGDFLVGPKPASHGASNDSLFAQCLHVQLHSQLLIAAITMVPKQGTDPILTAVELGCPGISVDSGQIRQLKDWLSALNLMAQGVDIADLTSEHACDGMGLPLVLCHRPDRPGSSSEVWLAIPITLPPLPQYHHMAIWPRFLVLAEGSELGIVSSQPALLRAVPGLSSTQRQFIEDFGL